MIGVGSEIEYWFKIMGWVDCANSKSTSMDSIYSRIIKWSNELLYWTLIPSKVRNVSAF